MASSGQSRNPYAIERRMVRPMDPNRRWFRDRDMSHYDKASLVDATDYLKALVAALDHAFSLAV